MRHRLLVHVTWTTRDRDPVLTAEIAQFLCDLLPTICLQERVRLERLGIVRTHVHALLWLHPTTEIPRLLQRLKGGSSVLANKGGLTAPADPLRWARGYSIESVSPRSLGAAVEYVECQDLHHPREAIPGWLPRPGPPSRDASSTPASL